MDGVNPAMALDFPRLARRGAELSGTFPVAALERLTPLLHDDSGTIAATLAFREDESGRIRVEGSVSGVVQLTCQRCLGPMAFEMAPRFDSVAVPDEAAAEALPDEFESLVWSEEARTLGDLVQDELILALPVIARHENDPYCRPYTADAPGGDGVVPETENPFAGLARLRGDN